MQIGSFSKLDNMDGRYVSLSCNNLLLGMFIVELDRPWSETPFPIDGFHIRKVEQIAKLQSCCKEVCIDISRGVSPKRLRAANLTILSSARKRAASTVAMKVSHDTYPQSRTVKQEIDCVPALYQQLGHLYSSTISNARDGNELALDTLAPAIKGMLESIIRCPDAFVWFLNRNKSENCLLKHSLRAAIWAGLLTRHMGFPLADMQEIFLGTLLADIGFAKYPEDFVSRQGPFKRREYLAYQKHVRIGVDILNVEGIVSNNIMNMVRSHHERVDGHGFPRGQSGDQISALARISNLAYSFDRLLKHGMSGADVAPAQAISRLYKQRGIKFNEQLVFEFIQALGMYPAGSLVELSSGELAMVVEQRATEKLQPRMAVLRGSDGQLLKKVRWLNTDDNKVTIDPPSIVIPLGASAFSMDVEPLCDLVFGQRIGFAKLAMRV